MASDRTVKVTAILQAQQYIAGLEQMKRKTRETSTDGAAALEQQKQAYENVGRSALAFGAFAAAGVVAAVSKFAEFDQSMSNVQASTHESAENMALLRQAALDAGADTAFSATEAADAIDELSKAGLSTADVMSGGLTGALSLAAAGGLGVARAAEISATALSQFGLAGSEAGHVADILAAGANKALGSVDDLANGLKYVGPVAASMGVSIEETTGVLALFAQQGILGEQAGTSLRGVLSSLSSPSKEAAREIEALGINVFDSNGKFIGLKGAAGELANAYQGMDDKSRQASLGIIFGRETITAATALYQSGADGVAEWTTAVDDSGFAAETAAIKLDNLNGDVEALGGSLETALIQSGSAANDTLRFLTQAATDAVNAFSGMPQPVQSGALAIGAVAGATSLAAGAFLTAVPKIAEFNASIETMSPGVQRASKAAIGLGKGLAVVAAGAAAVVVLDKIGSSGQKAAAGIEETTQALLESDLGSVFDGMSGDVNSFADGLNLLTGGDLNSQVERFGSTLNGLFFGGQLSDQVSTTREQFDNIGASLGQLVSAGDAERAAELFDELAATAEKQGISTEELMELLPGYSEALSGASNAQELGAETAAENATQLELLSGKAQDAEVDIDELADAIRGFGSAQLDVNSATREFEASIDDLSQSITDNGTTLDVSTEKGRSNQAALDEIASSALNLAAATLVRTGSEDQAASAVQRGRDQLISQLAQFGITGAAAEAYADDLGLIPDDVMTAVTLTGVEAAQQRLETFIDRNSGRTITVNTVLNERVAGFNSAGGITSADGNMIAYSNGGFAPGIYKGRAGAIHKFAEPETRWEAYISGKPGQEARNIAIWEDAGKRLGALSAFANGGMDARTLAPMPAHYSSSYSHGGKTIAPVVNQNGNYYSYDPTQIAQASARKLSQALALYDEK